MAARANYDVVVAGRVSPVARLIPRGLAAGTPGVELFPATAAREPGLEAEPC